ncbi:agmatinase [Gammaproteobacteria bacterium]|nr:agmatinase [Gammaproteobacteria bacterium]
MTRIAAGDQAFDYDSLYGTESEAVYSGLRSFMRRRLSRDLSGVDLAVLGIPYDLSTCGRSGTRFGPQAVREATGQLSWGEVWPWRFDPFDRLAAIDYGDVSFQRGHPEEMRKAVRNTAARIIDAGVFLVSIGGDHSVTLPLLQAHAAKHGPLSLLQFDAHRDTAASDWIDHGTFAWHAIQQGLIDPEHSVQVGIRTLYDESDPMTVLHRPWLRDHGEAAMLQKLRDVIGNRPVYLSFDIDCFDPAFAPGTGTPVVDGFTSHEIISLLRKLDFLNLVGIDLVEVSPPYDHAEITALLGASVLLELICLLASKRAER